MRKRVRALFLASCLALSLAVPAQAAKTEIKIQTPDELPAVGETFTVTVDISDNPGLAAVQFTLAFDESVVDCTNVKVGEILREGLFAANANAESGAIVSAASLEEMTQDGSLATYSFLVLEEGDPDFALAEYSFADKNAKAVEVLFTSNTTKAEIPEKEEKPSREEKPEKAPEKDAEKQTEAASPFTDTAGHESEQYIIEAVERGYFQGYADGSFKPAGNVTRGAFVTVLWRMAGRPEPSVTTPFTDIGNVSAEFQKAIAWAYGKGYINGRTATTFAPGDPMSRQATMKILFNHYGGGSGEEMMYAGIYDDCFTDSGTLGQFRAPMYWGIYHELITGKTPTTLGGATVADRALLATILVKYTDRFM